MSKRICSIDDCPAPAQARGWCPAHYQRWRLWGDPRGDLPVESWRVLGYTQDEWIDAFWAKVDWETRGSYECWLWLGSQGGGHPGDHYGMFRQGNQRLSTHRVAWELLMGPIEPEYTIDHICENKLCCNPRHMQQATLAENTSLQHERRRARMG